MNSVLNLRDAINDLTTKIGSNVDPIATAMIAQDCRQSINTWYNNGGIGSTICEFWADNLATEILISVNARSKAKTEITRAQKTQDFLIEKIDELDIVQIFRRCEVEAAINGGSPLLIRNLRSGQTINNVYRLEIAERKAIQPYHDPTSRAIVLGAYTESVGNRQKLLRQDDLIIFRGKNPVSSASSFDRQGVDIWGEPWIGGAVIQAAKQYEMSLLASNILLQLKSFQEIGIKNLFEKLSGADAARKQQELMSLLTSLALMGSNLSIRLTDKDESETKIVERSLAGVGDVVLAMRNNLLVQAPDIPEIYLFGYREKGGINEGAAKSDEERVDAKANLLWLQRWHSPLRKLIKILLSSQECPGDYQIKDITISRKSSYSPRPIEAAQVDQIRLQIEVDQYKFEQEKSKSESIVNQQ